MLVASGASTAQHFTMLIKHRRDPWVPSTEDELMQGISYPAALQKAKAAILDLGKRSQNELVLLENSTLTVEHGWVFFFTSAEFLRTNDPLDSVVGFGPLFIDFSGNTHFFPSGLPWKEALDRLVAGRSWLD